MAGQNQLFLFRVFYSFLFLKVTSSTFISKVVADKTCGVPAEQYFKTWQVDLPPVNRIPYLCNATDNNNNHPPEFMFDNKESTYWQSSAGIDKATIIIDIQSVSQPFLYVQHLIIKFGDYQRPGQIKISKSVDGGKFFTVWHHLVSFPFECKEIFGVEYLQRPFDVNDTVCNTYDVFVPQSTNETIVVDMLGGRGTSLSLQEWLKATHIKLEFSGMHKLFDQFSLRWHHYSVREINIESSCFCNGHATACSDINNNGSYQCICSNNTCGDQCNKCCPKFNQQKWLPGQLNPFVIDKDSTCEECNCFNHSTSCYFNQIVANFNASLNLKNVYNGGGVCTDCQHNTTGNNCEQCQLYYYHSPNINFTHPETCIHCNCSHDGSRNETSYQYLDCVKDNSIKGMVTGDCFCKENVYGKECNRCKPGFYNLTFVNNVGCEDCMCNQNGTINSSYVCSNNGQCQCKQFVVSKQCNQCQNGYYNLTKVNQNGCVDCLCNLGGSVSSTCNKTTGVCDCHVEEIYGEKCTEIKDTFYYPSLHFINNKNLIRTNKFIMAWNGKLEIPNLAENSKNKFRFVFKCSSIVDVKGIISVKNSKLPTSEIKLEKTCKNCYTITEHMFNLTAGNWVIEIAFPSVIATDRFVTCNEVIGLPEEFYNPKSLRNIEDFKKKCDVVKNNMTMDVCKRSVYTLTMDYLHTPLNCSCNEIGSVNNICEKYLGQCLCKPGIGGRACDQCLPGFYNITSVGCQPCECFTDDKVCHVETGQCNCPPFTEGNKCSKCVEQYWNLNKTSGCVHCNCSTTGAMSGKCNETTGQCTCKSGVQGQYCAQCKDQFTKLTTTGCLPCNCSVIGSQSNICNKETKQCLCRNNTTGILCDKCTPGSYYFSNENKNGCLDCYCSSISKNCSSAKGSFKMEPSSLLSWKIGTLNNELDLYNIYNETRESNRLMLSAAITKHSEPLFWRNNNFFGTSAASSYGGKVDFDLELFYNTKKDVVTTQQKIIFKGYNNQTIYQFFDTSITNHSEKIIVRLHERYWKLLNTNNQVSRHDFLNLLAKPVMLLISATPFVSSNFGYIVRIGEIKYSKFEESKTLASVDQVEQCECPTGYTGLSCEQCIGGYFHSTGKTLKYPYGECVPCQCNNHSSSCNTNNGICQSCQHNTEGNHCEQCQQGFYGNATLGNDNNCLQCPCSLPQAASVLCTQQNNGLISCLECSPGYHGDLCQQCSLGYFQSGETCLPCDCNNNSNSCNNVSGICSDCSFNTTGNHCESCLDGWYGDALKQHCKKCDCNLIGSFNKSCDVIGQCYCRSNVLGKDCSTCKNTTYALNNITGCINCDCNSYGSLDLQCSNNGKCSCKNHTDGMKCDQCIDSLWGLPESSCKECSCNVTGSFNKSCDHMSGQCFCQPGVSNRKCNSCMEQHMNFSSSGCDACPLCTQLLQKHVNTNINQLKELQIQSEDLLKLNIINNDFNNASMVIKNAEMKEEEFSRRLTSLETNIKQYKSKEMNDTIYNIQYNVIEYDNEMKIFLVNNSIENNRLRLLQQNTSKAFHLILDANSSLTTTINHMDTLINDAFLMNKNLLSYNFNNTAALNVSINAANEDTINGINDVITLGNKFVAFDDNVTRVNMSVNLITPQFDDIVKTYNEMSLNLNTLKEFYDTIVTNITRTKQLLQDAKMLERNDTIEIINLDVILRNITNNLVAMEIILNETAIIDQVASHDYNNQSVTLNANKLNQSITTNDVFISKDILISTLNATLILYNQSQLFESLFESAAMHGQKASSSIELYDNTVNMVVILKNTSAVINTTSKHIFNMLNSKQENNLTYLAASAFVESIDLLNSSNYQNFLVQGIKNQLLKFNLSYTNTSSTWNNISFLYNDLNMPNTRESLFLNALWQNITTERDDIQRIMGNIKDLDITSVENVTVEFHKKQNKLTSCMDDIAEKDIQIRNQLNSSDILISNVDASIRLVNESNDVKMSIHDNLQSLREKIKLLKVKAAEIEVPVRFEGESILQINQSNDVVNKPTMQLEFAVQTNQKNSFLFELRDHFMKQHFTVQISNTFLQVEYLYDNKSQININYEVPMSNGAWKQVLFTRLQNSSRLTVTSLDTGYSRTYGTFNEYSPNSMKGSGGGNSMQLYIGGSKISPSFIGCMSSLKINNNRINLMKEAIKSSSTNHTACNGIKSVSTGDATVDGVSCYGNGHLLHQMGNFTILNKFKISMKFRTLKENGTLLVIEDERKINALDISLKNKRIVITVTTNSTSFFKSKMVTYTNGKWYTLKFDLNVRNLTMEVYNNENVIKERSSFIIDKYSNDGKFIWIGGINKTSSQSLIGCIQSLQLSDQSGGFRNRDLKGTHLITSYGVNFNGCLREVQAGLHYNTDGYSIVAFTSQQSLQHIRIKLKTTNPNGLIFTRVSNNSILSILLYHGNLFIQTDNLILYTSAQTLNDNQVHDIIVSFNQTSLSLNIDNGDILNTRNYLQRPYIYQGTTAYVGSLPSNFDATDTLLTTKGFVGDILAFEINKRSYMDELLSNSYQVSGDGVSVTKDDITPTQLPTIPPTTTPPPTCSKDAPKLEYSKNKEWVGFQGNTTLALQPQNGDYFLTFFKVNYVITVEFRAILPNGLLFYITNGNNKQYITLELIDGQLKYQFNAGNGVVSVRTDKLYNTGEWFKVYVIRISQFGAILVSDTQEYHNAMNGNTFSQMELSLPFYVGNIPVGLDNSMLQASSIKSFHGGIRKIEIAETVNSFIVNLQNDRVFDTKNIRPCYVTVTPQVTFRGDGYFLSTLNITTTKSFAMEFMFKSSRHDGVLWYVGNEKHALYMKLEHGKVSLIEQNNTKSEEIMFWMSEKLFSNNVSYHLCNGITHHILIDRLGSIYRMYVNNKLVTIATKAIQRELFGKLYIGGTPSLSSEGFYGCIESFKYKNEVVDFSKAIVQNNMQYGCSSG